MISFNFLVVLCSLAFISVNCSKDWTEEMFPYKWNQYSKNRINHMLTRKLNGNVAKNVILYLGDGMGVSTVTAGRILKGQLAGDNGEDHITVMENLDHMALSKTYNIDAQTADSAGTATAYLTGVKTRIGAIGVDGTAIDCNTTKKAALESILKWAHFAGKSVGIVTTARVTHATPSATYANVPTRKWEAYDGVNFGATEQNQGCKDIAAQLIEENSFINLIFGGGRMNFLRNTDSDYAASNKKGVRTDNRNLIDEWQQSMKDQNLDAKFLWNMTDFMNLQPYKYDRVLGLLSYDHMKYELDRDVSKDEPSIIDMTKKAIEILRTNPRGYFLLVEGGKIDLAHHEGMAKRALNEYVKFDEAIAEGLHLTDEQETLSVVTADHSHVFTIGAYSDRGHNLFETNVKKGILDLDLNNKSFTPLLYANGPGKRDTVRTTNLTNEETNGDNYLQEAAIKLGFESHGGEDVAIYASGPMAYLFDGTVEQSHIAHVMAYSACIGPYNESQYVNCKGQRGVLTLEKSGANSIYYITNFYLVLSVAICVLIIQ